MEGERHSLNGRFSKRKSFDLQIRNQLSSVHICWAQTLYAAFCVVCCVAFTGIIISWGHTPSYSEFLPRLCQFSTLLLGLFNSFCIHSQRQQSILDIGIKWYWCWGPHRKSDCGLGSNKFLQNVCTYSRVLQNVSSKLFRYYISYKGNSPSISRPGPLSVYLINLLDLALLLAPHSVIPDPHLLPVQPGTPLVRIRGDLKPFSLSQENPDLKIQEHFQTL